MPSRRLFLKKAGATGALSVFPGYGWSTQNPGPVYTYTLAADGTTAAYDEALAVASLQGIINRRSGQLYVLSPQHAHAQYWLELLSSRGRWLAARDVRPLRADLQALVQLAGRSLKGVIIWDPMVPATVNVATTMAGVHDALVLSPEYADRYLARLRLPLIRDLRGRFTGSETGSRKNDAYRWAIREFLDKGLCSSRWLCLFQDSFSARSRGNLGYVVSRDWAVQNRAFVFDLSPWGDETPADDPRQKIGTDLDTYRMILARALELSRGRHMIGLQGFFLEFGENSQTLGYCKYMKTATHESTHGEGPTEQQMLQLISSYNTYMSQGGEYCFNQSLHRLAPRPFLKQRRAPKPVPLERKTYICMPPMDDGVYAYMPSHWDDGQRGKLPVTWCNFSADVVDIFPDIVAYYYQSASDADNFAALCGAGYIYPSCVHKEYLPLLARHSRHYFQATDITIDSMLIETELTAEIKSAFSQFAPDGLGMVIGDWRKHNALGVPADLLTPPREEVWQGMPIIGLTVPRLMTSDIHAFNGIAATADALAKAIGEHRREFPRFYLFRLEHSSPSDIAMTYAELQRKNPEWHFELLDLYTFFSLYKQHLEAS